MSLKPPDRHSDKTVNAENTRSCTRRHQRPRTGKQTSTATRTLKDAEPHGCQESAASDLRETPRHTQRSGKATSPQQQARRGQRTGQVCRTASGSPQASHRPPPASQPGQRPGQRGRQRPFAELSPGHVLPACAWSHVRYVHGSGTACTPVSRTTGNSLLM